MNLKLEKPLVVLDLEATGLNPRADRIVEFCFVKLMPDGTKEVKTQRLNPEMPIPPGATAIHGITNDDVKDCPTFDAVARELSDFLSNCDFGGFNIIHFDIPMLEEEFIRARLPLIMEGRRVVDAQRIYHKMEPRDLSAAVQYFCNRTLEGAHGAEADAIATLEVIEGQLARYDDLPHDMDGLDEFCTTRRPEWADRSGRLCWSEGEIVLNFGKRRGTSLKSLVDEDPGYLRWMLKSDFPRDTQDLVHQAMNGFYPDPPEGL